MLFLLFLLAILAAMLVGGKYQVQMKTTGGFNITYVVDGRLKSLF